jgi:hypothetical protein
MAAPQLIALTKVGEIRNQDPTLYGVIKEVQQQTNDHILRQSALVGLLRSNGDVVTAAEISGDGTTNGSNDLAVTGLNGTSLGGLGTGILKNTTVTGVPSIAVAGDFPVLNQDTTGKAAALATTGAAVNVAAAAPPTAGQALVATDPTHATWQAVAASGGVLFSQTADSTTTANTNSTMFGTGVGSLTLPANFFVPGKGVRAMLAGYSSTADGSPGAKTIFGKLGGTWVVIATSISNTAFPLSFMWAAEVWLVCRTAGAWGTFQGGGWFTLESDTSHTNFILGNSIITNIDTTGTLVLDVAYNNGVATGALRTTFACVEAL